MELQDQISIKVVIIGDGNVGKTSVACRFVNDTFNIKQQTTVMGAYYEAERNYGDLPVKFVIWDTAGQERFQAITPLYYRGAQAAVIIYDITSVDTFTNVRKWFDQLNRNAGSIKAMILCGNKSDREEEREISLDEGSVMASELGMSFHECSAKTGKDIDAVFKEIVSSLFEGEHIRNTSAIANYDEIKMETKKTGKKKEIQIKQNKKKCF